MVTVADSTPLFVFDLANVLQHQHFWQIHLIAALLSMCDQAPQTIGKFVLKHRHSYDCGIPYVTINCWWIIWAFSVFCVGDFQLNFDFWRKLDSRLGPQLGQLASDIAEHYAKRTNTLVYVPRLRPFIWSEQVLVPLALTFLVSLVCVLFHCHNYIIRENVHQVRSILLKQTSWLYNT